MKYLGYFGLNLLKLLALMWVFFFNATREFKINMWLTSCFHGQVLC